MTTTNPLDRIEVGKQYRYVPRPNLGFRCPVGGHVFGLSPSAQHLAGQVVTVLTALDTDVVCSTCDAPMTPPEGTYRIRFGDGTTWATVWPWLQPLEPSGPEPRGG